MKKILLFITIISISLFIQISLESQHASATQLKDWDAGHIIDDGIFTDSRSMNVDQIQAFLNSKVPICDNWGTNGSTPTSRRDYILNHGYTLPMTCLKDYKENGLSTAQIIYNSAQTYNINPQVLIVLLQKEQSLVTDDWPTDQQYKSATGYGCPDTAPCDSQYYGLTNQIDWAARMFRAIMNNSPTWYTPYILGNNYINWSPNQSCGGTIVNIQNRSTQALYNYTPYQPNQAALDAGYGSGDSCSSHGNRNFFLYFNDWFGNSLGSPYSWRVMSQTYTLPGGVEQTYDNGIPADAGDIVTLKLTVRNNGSRTWYQSGDNPILLATWEPSYRTSQFQTDSWPSKYRAAHLQEASVKPGQDGTFIFTVKAPKPGNYGEYFNLVAEGSSWFPTNGIIRFNFNVHSGYHWQIVSQTFGQPEQAYDNGIPADLNQVVPVTIRLKNTGDVTWHNDGPFPVRIATWNPPYHDSAMYDIGWLNKYRPATLTESAVLPGEIGTFKFNIVASKLGNYGEYFNLVSEGAAWFPEEQMLRFNLNVHSKYSWEVVSQSYGTTSPTNIYDIGVPIKPGETKVLKIILKNTGDTTWTNNGDNPVRLATWLPSYRISKFQDLSWISPVRIGTQEEAVTLPGQNATFVFKVTAPLTVGNYGEYFNLVSEGAAWFSDDKIMRFNLNVWP